MTEPVVLFARDETLSGFVRDLLAHAEDAWTRRVGPAGVLQAIHARLAGAEPGVARRAFCLSLIEGSGRPQAQAMVSGGIRARFEAEIGPDEGLCAAFARTYAQWPQTARILHFIRLFRAAPGSGALPSDMDALLDALIRACSNPATFGDAPLEMCHGFLHAAAGSDRISAPVQAEALTFADRLLLTTQARVPPSVLLRSIGRAAAATRRAGATAWARACIGEAGIAGCLLDPALVHVAALALFRETGVGLGGALALLKDAAPAQAEAAGAFALATTLKEDGLFCRGLLVRPSGGRTRRAATPAAEADTPRLRTGRRKPQPMAPVPEAAAPVAEKERPRRGTAEPRPSLRQRTGPPPGDTEAGMHAATRRAATRLLKRLRAKNAEKDTIPG